jgi:prepilin-type N-terminal cleavage/methylation domain-containing protein
VVKQGSFLQKSAFTMIELIFAIVIIAISVMSLPMMTQINASGIEKGYVQEAIFASSAEIHQALSHRWDANSAPDGDPASLSQVLDIAGDCNAITKRRPGQSSRRCLNDTTLTAANAANAIILNINNATGVKDLFVIDATDNGSGYKLQKVKLTLAAINPASFGIVNNGNIKQITATVRDNGKTIITLYSYSFNIGEVDPIKRSFL